MLKLIFKSVNKRKKKLVLLTVQFIIGFSSLLFGLSTIENLLQYKKNIERLAPLDTLHLYVQDEEIGEFTDQQLKDYKTIVKTLTENKLVDTLGQFEQEYLLESEDSKEEIAPNVIMANQELLKMINFELSSGSDEKVKSYESGSVVPILVSKKAEQSYPLGTQQEFYYYEEEGTKTVTMKVVGIVESPINFWDSGCSQITDSVMGNDLFIICPIYKEYSSPITYETNIIATLPVTENMKEAIEKIEQVYAENNKLVEIHTLKEGVDRYYEGQQVIVMATMIFSTVILLLSILGCIGTLLSSILSRKTEFGIYFAMGLSKKNLVRLVCGEIMVILLFSFLVSATLTTVGITIGLKGTGFVVNVRMLAMAFGILLLCSGLCILMPLKKVTTLKPVDLIYGRDN